MVVRDANFDGWCSRLRTATPTDDLNAYVYALRNPETDSHAALKHSVLAS
jgi:hypothetical protein